MAARRSKGVTGAPAGHVRGRRRRTTTGVLLRYCGVLRMPSDVSATRSTNPATGFTSAPTSPATPPDITARILACPRPSSVCMLHHTSKHRVQLLFHHHTPIHHAHPLLLARASRHALPGTCPAACVSLQAHAKQPKAACLPQPASTRLPTLARCPSAPYIQSVTQHLHPSLSTATYMHCMRLHPSSLSHAPTLADALDCTASAASREPLHLSETSQPPSPTVRPHVPKPRTCQSTCLSRQARGPAWRSNEMVGEARHAGGGRASTSAQDKRRSGRLRQK